MAHPRTSAAVYHVRSISSTDQYKKINLATTNKGKSVQICVHRFAVVGKADSIYIDPNRMNYVYVISSEDPNDFVRITPHFEKSDTSLIGNMKLTFLLKEIVTLAEYSDYQFLEGFHYKSSAAIASDIDSDEDNSPKNNGGRKAVLLCYVKSGTGWQVAGYIELQMPLLMVKPRHNLFNQKFCHPNRPVSWDSWKVDTIKQYVNLIVRIARVVITPELRGAGLSKLLIRGAKEFVKERWQVGGKRPLFMEISAEMLKYVDFVTTAGMHYVGDTEGNLKRVHKDLTFMQRGYKIASGIMTLQKKYLTNLESLSTNLGRNLADTLQNLKTLTNTENEEVLRERLNTLESTDWCLFRKVLRFPIPYYLCGLDEYSDRFILEGTSGKTKVKGEVRRIKSARIRMIDIKVSSKFSIPDSESVRAIRECFGIESQVISTKLLGPMNIEASGGNIILINGPSGSGKTILLRILDPRFSDSNIMVQYGNKASGKYSAAWLSEIDSDKPLIDYFALKWGMEAAISALNQAGLSEAFVYLRPYKLLSRGQQYRARIAELALGEDPVWLIDEFCTDLDPFTAKIVASNLRKTVTRSGRIAFVAAANNMHFVEALKPTQVITLRPNGKAKATSLREYTDELCF